MYVSQMADAGRDDGFCLLFVPVYEPSADALRIRGLYYYAAAVEYDAFPLMGSEFKGILIAQKEELFPFREVLSDGFSGLPFAQFSLYPPAVPFNYGLDIPLAHPSGNPDYNRSIFGNLYRIGSPFALDYLRPELQRKSLKRGEAPHQLMMSFPEIREFGEVIW